MHGCFRLSFHRRQWHFHSKPRQRLLCLQLPLSAPEPLRRGLIPLCGVRVAPGLLMELRELKRDHRVIRGLVKCRKLRRGIFARSSFADSSLDVSPVWHVQAFYQCRALRANLHKAFPWPHRSADLPNHPLVEPSVPLGNSALPLRISQVSNRR